MTVKSHRLTAGILLVLMLAGPFQAVALAQSAAQPAAAEPAPAPAPQKATGAYDFGANVVTVLKAPFNVALCVLGTVAGLGLFALTFGTNYQVATQAVEQGCDQKWTFTGDDLRSEPPTSEAFDWETHRYDWEPK